MRKTKIICTLGPAVDSEEKICELMKNGMDCARLNFSHGSHDEQKERMDKVKRVRKALNLPVPIMLDTKGPEVRMCDFEGGFAVLEAGQYFTLDTNHELLGTSVRVAVTYEELPSVLRPGTRILVDDGKIALSVVDNKNNAVLCKVINGGIVSNHKSINVPGVNLPMPYISQKDYDDIIFGIEQNVDYISASFVRCKDDVLAIREILKKNGAESIQIISKIECTLGIENLDEIIAVSDGIMVARGDLGVEVSFEQVPSIQKDIISKCIKAGKIVITATQMLESMMDSLRPLRAEVSDIANAIYDGTTAIMLSGETAAGKHPIDAVRTMAQIAEYTEGTIDYKTSFLRDQCRLHPGIAETICIAACQAADYIDARAIIVVTRSGQTAEFLSDFRPNCPIIAITLRTQGLRQINLRWGVKPVAAIEHSSLEQLFDFAADAAVQTGLVETGDKVVIVAGSEIKINGLTDMIKVCEV